VLNYRSDVDAIRLRSRIARVDKVAPGLASVLRRSPLRAAVVRARHRRLGEAAVALGSYPRSGNTWVKLVLSHLIAGRDVGLWESERLVPVVGSRHLDTASRTGARIVKTHEPYRPEYRRGIYVIRDVRDVAVSYFEIARASGHWRGNLDDFLHTFAAGRLDGYGPWDVHVRGWMDARATADVLLVRYEDLLATPRESFRSIAEFAGLQATDTDLTDALVGNGIAEIRAKEVTDEYYVNRVGWSLESAHRVRSSSNGWKTRLNPTQVAMLARFNPALIAAGYEAISA
jgi:hypothetical protein